MEKVLEFKIELDEIYEVNGSLGNVAMILFRGICESDIFQGKVLPGAVDTQVQRNGADKIISAKYILEGTDQLGCKCRIFVDNCGTVRNGTSLLKTKPMIMTDSVALKWLETANLSGSVEQEQDYIIIKIYHE